MSYRGIDQTAADTVELRRALRDLQNRADAAGLGNRNLGQVVRAGNAPPIVTGLSGFAQMQRIFLTWNDSPAADLARYEIQASTSPVFAGAQSFNTGNAWFTFEGATTGTTYYFRVRAINISGNAAPYSNVLSITPGGLTSGDVSGASSESPIVLLDSVIVNGTAVSSVDFESLSLSSYLGYLLVFDHARADINNVSQAFIRLKMSGSWKSGATDYGTLTVCHDSDNILLTSFSTSTSEFNLNVADGTIQWGDNAVRKSGCGWVRIMPPPDGNGKIIMDGLISYLDADGDYVGSHAGGNYKGGDTDVLQGIRFAFDTSAQVEQGRFYLYGYRDLRS